MKFLKRFFNKKIKMLGRAGIIYNDGTTKYFIDSESLLAPPYDVVIYVKRIRYFDNNARLKVLTNTEKLEIANKVKSELDDMGMTTDLFV